MDGPLARGPWRPEPAAAAGTDEPATLPDNFVFRSDEPQRLEAAATRAELAGAGMALLATPLLVFAPTYTSTIPAAIAAPALAVAATGAFVARRPGPARHLLGGSAFALLAAVAPGVSFLLSPDLGPSILRVAATVFIPIVLLAAALLRAVAAERNRRLAWGIRKRERMDRDRELGRRLTREPGPRP